MRKLFRYFSVLFSLLAIFVLASCSNGTDIKGIIETEATRDTIKTFVSFDKNEKLAESTTTVSVKLYNIDDEYQQVKSVSLENQAEGEAEFTGLTKDTEYIIRLWVSVNSYEYEIAKTTQKTSAGGDTADDPIIITTKEEFLEISNDSDAYYQLGADIDFADSEGEPTAIDLFKSSSSCFKGSFDGKDKDGIVHTIKNFKISSATYMGLFGYMKEATVKNLKLEGVTAALNSSKSYSGALSGYAEKCTIENVTVDGYTLTSSTTSSSIDCYAAGLIGFVKNTSVVDSSVSNFKPTFSQVRSNLYFGGFIGQAEGTSKIEGNSANLELSLLLYASGKDMAIGGFIGECATSSTLKNCLSTGKLEIKRTDYRSNLYIGGFAARGKVGHCTLDNCAAVVDISISAGTEESPVQLSEKLYVGGLVGYVAYTKGITNSFYVSLNDGIKIISKIDNDTKDNNFISLTIAKNDITSKVTNVYSFDDKLAVIGISEEEGKTEVKDTVIINSSITNDLSVLSDLMRDTIKNIKGIE